MNTRKILWIFIGLTAGYLLLTLTIPADANTLNRYKISPEEIQLLRLSLAIPLIAAWFVSYYGYSRFRDYLDTLEKTKEYKPFSTLLNGLLLLSLYLPVSSIISSIASYISATRPEMEPALTIIRNYISLALLLAAFYLLYKGSRALAGNLEKLNKRMQKFLVAAVVVLSGAFAVFTLMNPVRQFPSDTSPEAAYYLPDWLIITTIIIPYILVFYWGLYSVLNIHAYRKNTRGILYKRSLGYMANGIGTIVLSLIIIRYFSAFTTQLSEATLKLLLLIIYILIAVIAAGYILIALGANKLKKIEEI